MLTEGKHPLEFLQSEGNGNISRERITVISGAGLLVAGAILGQILVGAAASAAKAGGNTGNGALTLDAVTPVRAGAKPGVYTVRCIAAAVNSGTFRVEDPTGNVIGDVLVGATFDDDIKFVIADGGVDFVVGDGFDITVAVGSKKWTASPAASADGSDVAKGVLAYNIDATAADVDTVAIVRQAEVRGGDLTYHASVDDNAKKAAKIDQLAAAGIIVR